MKPYRVTIEMEVKADSQEEAEAMVEAYFRAHGLLDKIAFGSPTLN